MKNLVIFLIVFLISCTEQYAEMKLKSSIIFGGNSIYKYDLDTKTEIVLVKSPKRLIQHIEYIDSEKLLISLLDLKPSKQRSQIEIWSPNGTVLEKVSVGANAVYMENHEIIIYNNKNGDLVTTTLGGAERKEILIELNNRFEAKPVLKSGKDTFLYIKELQGQYQIAEYNIIRREENVIQFFSKCSLDKSFWLKERDALLCQERAENGALSGKYSVIRRDGESKSLTFSDKGLWPITSLEKDRYILLQDVTTTNFGTKEIYPLFIFDMTNDVITKVSDNTPVTSNALIYREL